jgi:hypothetical protein
MSLKETNKYDDIIGLLHPTSPKHPRMTGLDRAAQFSPFAALTGYEKALEETKEIAIDKVANEIETEEWQDI